ncbi:MAG: Mur ligase family protein [Geminicoccaceae bacterium]
MWTKLRHLRTPLGRKRLRKQAATRLVPLVIGVARWHRRRLGARTRLVAIIGSIGKSTTTAAITAVLEPGARPSTRNGMERAVVEVLRCGPWRRHATLEAALGKTIDMARFGNLLQPDVTVITAIASDHGPDFGSLEAVRDEKARFLGGIRAGGRLVINGDDPQVRAMVAGRPEPVVTYGHAAGNTVRAVAWQLDWPHGTRLTVAVGERTVEVRSRLLGLAMTYPVLAALAVAMVEGVALERAVAALATVAPAPCRLQLLPLPGGGWIIDDSYKCTLESMDAALDLLAQVPGRRLAVLGPATDIIGSAKAPHRRIGARLPGLVDLAVLVASSSKPIASGAAAAGMPRSSLIKAGDTAEEALAAIRPLLRPGDVVLVKGRHDLKLSRVALALAGRDVRCRLDRCRIFELACGDCPMLGRATPDVRS